MELSGAVAKAARFRLSAAVALPLLLLEWLGVAEGRRPRRLLMSQSAEYCFLKAILLSL